MLVKPIAVGWAEPASQKRESKESGNERERVSESRAIGVRNTKRRDRKRGEEKSRRKTERKKDK